MRHHLLIKLLALAALVGIPMTTLAQAPPAATPAPNPNFTGKVTRLTDDPVQVAHFRFEPGARTKWHIHEKGQIILVEEGVGLAQVKGGPIVVLHAGETVYGPPGVAHWHGAAPDQGGVQFNITRGGITWLEEVSETDYNARPKPLADFKLRGDRFPPLTADKLSPAQKTLLEDALKPPAGTVNGPYNVFLRSPEMGDLAHQWGAYTRFRASVPARLNELAIIMSAQFWKSEFVWYAHKRAALAAGLAPPIAEAIAAGKRPTGMKPDEEAVYNFCNELLTRRQVSDSTFASAKSTLGEQGVVDIVAGMGYFQFVSMLLDVDRYPLPDGVKPELN